MLPTWFYFNWVPCVTRVHEKTMCLSPSSRHQLLNSLPRHSCLQQRKLYANIHFCVCQLEYDELFMYYVRFQLRCLSSTGIRYRTRAAVPRRCDKWRASDSVPSENNTTKTGRAVMRVAGRVTTRDWLPLKGWNGTKINKKKLSTARPRWLKHERRNKAIIGPYTTIYYLIPRIVIPTIMSDYFVIVNLLSQRIRGAKSEWRWLWRLKIWMTAELFFVNLRS